MIQETKSVLKELVAIHSTFPNESDLAIYAEKLLKNCGFKVNRVKFTPNRWNILAERGEGSESLLFYGHLDTVPIYGNWQTDPLTLTAKGDELYGLGSCDMKGGIACMLAAIQQVDPKIKIKIALGVDEENISEGAWNLVQKRKDWFNDAKVIVIGEPGASAAQIGGVDVVTLGRRGRVVYSIEVFGKSAHGAHPERGINAISQASKIVLALEKLKLKSHPLLKNSTLFVRKFESAATSLSLPDKAYLEVDKHLVIPETIASAQKELEDLINSLYEKGILSRQSDQDVKVSVKSRPTPYMEPYVTQKNIPAIAKIINLIETNFNQVTYNYGKSVADDNAFAVQLKKPVITIGPRGGNMHAANEWVSEKDLNAVTKLYKLIIENT